MKEMCVIPKSVAVFHFAVLAEALDYGGCEAYLGQLYGSPTALTSQYLAWDRYCTYAVQTPRLERRIFLEQIKPTVAPAENHAREASL